MSQRVVARVLGVVRHDEHERLTPLLPPVVQFNAEPGDGLVEGQTVELRVLVEVQSFVPTPIPEPGT